MVISIACSFEALRCQLRGPFLESPGNFSGLQRQSLISNLTITELFYSHILNTIQTEVLFIQEVTDELKSSQITFGNASVKNCQR